jgi:hypothetical protein
MAQFFVTSASSYCLQLSFPATAALEAEQVHQIADRWTVQRNIGLLLLVTGLGKLSRLRPVSGASPQFASINFRIEAWSA